jgi:perosamine synthetase
MADETAIDLPLLEEREGSIVLFYQHVPARAAEYVSRQLGTRWIGQGPAVDAFERAFSSRFCGGSAAVAVGSGTDALHLAYILAGVGPGDEVISPLFTCTATNIPILYRGATPVFADVQRSTLNIDPDHVRALVSARTKAIVCVHYGGLPCDMDELRAIATNAGVPLIEDAAHAVGATYKGASIGALSEFTVFSFQAIKHITTGDGGMLVVRDRARVEQARRIRWFGIDRAGKQAGIWDNDIWELGYKYQMTDIAAAMGLAALEEFARVLEHRRTLLRQYCDGLRGVPGIHVIGDGYRDREHAAWLCTVAVERRRDLQLKLRERNIESNPVHYRNDRYTLFKDCRGAFPNMDAIDDQYLVLPLHTRLSSGDVGRVVETIRGGW